MPGVTHNTASFENFLLAIEEKNIPVTVPSPGQVFEAGLIHLQILAPVSGPYDQLFPCTADGTRAKFLYLHRRRRNPVRKGNDICGTYPAFGYIESGPPRQRHSYGHPHQEVMDLLSEPARGIHVLRTDTMGNIIMLTDGTEIKLYVNQDMGDM
jgi:beta-lactamase superfamily II metal-dependent hydrolase